MSESTGLYECHGHIMMDGADFKSARLRHSGGVCLPAVRDNLDALQSAGVAYFRDGGDALGVSTAAREMAGDWGIEYATPMFAIHRRGYYGGIVGRGYSDLAEYRALVREAKVQGCDFIKLMFSGILTFRAYGELSCPGLPPEEIRELVHIAHGEGFRVMAHVNGAETVRAAIDGGTDSIEHGYFMDEVCLRMLADSGSIWVPTITATAAFRGRDGFDAVVTADTVTRQTEAVSRGAALGAKIACGSDGGAFGVAHGIGAAAERELLINAGVPAAAIAAANEMIRKQFRAQG